MSKVQLKGGFFTHDRRLDRIPEFDERSRQFAARHLIAAAQAPRSFSWSCATVLDQGPDGACVGFGWSHEAAAKPAVVPGINYDVAFALYRRAQQLDEWPGEDYEGSSVIAGAKAANEKGWITSYRWNFGIDDTILALGYLGPVVLGTNWYDAMFDVDAKVFISPGVSKVAGGHCYLANKVNVKEEYVTVHNSWGRGWGNNGEAKLRFKDLDRLLREAGESCVPMGRKVPKAILSSVGGSNGREISAAVPTPKAGVRAKRSAA